jgi:protein phosphatase
VEDGGIGIVVTRTGRRFFADPEMEHRLLDSVGTALTKSGLWDELSSDWVCLDCELMPWSAKAQELLKQQYAAVGASATASLTASVEALGQTSAETEGITPLRDKFEQRRLMAGQFVEAYRRYCWPVESLSDLQLAPFHILASEKTVHSGKDHLWHMGALGRLCEAGGGLLLATPHKTIQVTNAASVAEGTQWWEELTGRGGEGMVVKPLDFVTRGARGIVQPAVKCRGREYLRIIYGPEYMAPENLERLRPRSLAGKRSLALREFALGLEGLERFVRREPLRRVHECVFGVLALESEPVDPRL